MQEIIDGHSVFSIVELDAKHLAEDIKSTSKLVRENKNIPIIYFDQLILLMDEETILGLENNRNLYLIDMSTLSYKKLDISLPKSIQQIAVGEEGDVWAIFKDGNYFNLTREILKKSITNTILHDATALPSSLINNMIVPYEGYGRFFNSISLVPETPRKLSITHS